MALTTIEPFGINSSNSFTFANVTATGNITGNFFIGNGSQLTGLPESYSNANVAAYLPTYTGNISADTITANTFTGNITGGSNTASTVTASAQPNITSVGTLTSVSSTGNITGAYILGNGSGLGSISGANVTGTVANATYATSAGSATSATTADTVTTSAQPNITSVGTLTSLSSSGNITGAYFIGNGSQLTGLPESYANANVAAYLPTYTGNLVSLQGNVTTTANISASHVLGNGSGLSSITGANVTDQVANALVSGTVYTAAQPNITSVGTLSSLSVTGNISTAGLISGNAAGASNLVFGNITTFSTANITTDELYLQATTRLEVTASGSSGYLFDQYGAGLNPTLYARSGDTLAFNLAVTGHPFLIRLGGANYSTGLNHVTTLGVVSSDAAAQGQEAGTLYWKIPYGITGNYQYQCSVHGGMLGTIAIADANTSNISIASAGTVTASAQPNITSVGTLTSLSSSGNITGNYFVGNGSQLTGLPESYGNANVAAYLPTYTGNLVALTGNVTTTANVSANYFLGNGSQLTGIAAGGGTTTFSSTAPVSPAQGDIWIDADSGIQYIYFNDNTSSQWAEMEAQTSISPGADLSAVAANILPAADVTYDLGSATYRWRDIYLSGNTINLGGATIKTDAGSGAIALIPEPTEANPNPSGMVVSPSGGITVVATVGGEVSGNAIANAAASPTAAPVPIDITTTAPTNGQALIWDSANEEFVPGNVGGGTPGGANTQIQFNNAGEFAGSANLTWSGTTLDVIGTANISANITVGNILTDGYYYANGEPFAGGGGATATVYGNIGSLPLANVTTGSMAFVSGNNRLYLWNGTGWFNIALINTNPTITSGPDASYVFATDGTPTVLTLVAEDPEGIPITWSYQVTSGSLGSTATISQADNVFTITPSNSPDYSGSFSVTFTASDGVNIATAASSFTLVFPPSWALPFINQQAKIQASDTAPSDRFGTSVAVSGNTVVVGAYLGDPVAQADAGAVYIFTRSGTTWTQQAKLVASDAQATDWFGSSVAIDGDTVVVGAHAEDTGGSSAGSAYIFTRSGTTWTQQAKIQAGTPQAPALFGYSVAIDGDTVVVGAYMEDVLVDQGATYIFTRSGTTWTQQARLVASDAQTSDNFGYSVAISGNTVVVGARYEDPGAISDAGAAYIFTRSGTTWTQQAKLVASDAQASDNFGWSVAIDGDTVVVGAYLEDPSAISDAGSAYIFTRSGTTWTQQQKIQASDAQATDWFGHSVAIDGDVVVVGAHLEDTVAASAGAAYIFSRSGTTWTQQSKIQASDPENSDWFGWSVAIDGDTVVVGAEREDTVGADAGAAYIFKGNTNYQTGADTPGQQLFTTPGTYSWTAPAGVTAVSVVAIGGGGAGGAAYYSGGGGGGGGVGWKSRITVVPGSSYTVQVGAGGIGVTANAGGIGTPGGDSYFIDNTVVVGGGGGAGQGSSDNTNVNRAGGAGGTFVGDGGSAGGAGGTSSGDTAGGGGGAGGYNGSAYLGPAATMATLTGRGVGFGATTFAAPFNGGGGAGGQYGNPTAGSGGGVGALGAGTNGNVASAGGSGGTAGGAVGVVGAGGLYGGGGGGQSSDSKNTPGSNGGNGAVRIIWGASRAYPSTNTANV